MIVATALVLMMTPRLALSYGGMVTASSVLNVMTLGCGAIATVAVAWGLWGYSLTFGPCSRPMRRRAGHSPTP